MSTRCFHVALGLLLVCTRLSAATDSAIADRMQDPPNIVYIMADDLGYGDVACFGNERCRVATPHFDRLAAEGMRFTDAHTVASVCVPARVAIMTGRYPWRFRRPRPSGPWGFLNPQLPAEQFTLGHLLRSAGYRTGYVGKWHLGTLMQTHDGENQNERNVDYARPLRLGPVQAGFDESFILPGSLDMYPYAFVRNNQWVGDVTAQKGWSAFNRVGPAEKDFQDDRVLETFCREAEQFIAESARRERPFFLYLALTSPHTPVSPRAEFRGRSDIGPYGDFVMETDDCVGRVLASLESAGITEQTLVLATSDHGPAPYAGPQRKAVPGQVHELERQRHYPAGQFRGYKFSVYEGGLRVPFVARWPGVVPAGTECGALIGLNDLLATCADLAGTALEPNQAPDSHSFLPLLKNPQATATRRTLIMRSTQRFVVRDENWKLALCPGSGCTGKYGNRPTPEQAWETALSDFGRKPNQEDLRRAPFVQLYDLARDPREQQNLAARHSDRIAGMVSVLEDAINRGRTTPGPPLANDVPRVNIAGPPVR